MPSVTMARLTPRSSRTPECRPPVCATWGCCTPSTACRARWTPLCLLSARWPTCCAPRSVERLDDVFDHFLRVAEHHHRLVLVEQRIVQAGIARRHAPLVHEHAARLVNIKHWHAVDRAALFIGQRVDDVIGTQHERHIGRAEFAVDVLHLEYLVIGHL